MEKRSLICIGCPMGCLLTVEQDNGKIISVSGNTCSKGAEYAHKELTNPTRIVTTTVKVENGKIAVVSVKTKKDIPKEKIGLCVGALKNITVKAPITMGDVIIKNVAGTGVDIIATKNVEKQA